ncbi:MAG: DUF2263 domain-containing protein [Selenomonas sp.]|nr:DUF2263 domain-containing protein [Selenomonas sp.]
MESNEEQWQQWRRERLAKERMKRGFETRRAAFVDTQRRVLEDARLSPYSCAVTETILNSGSDDCKKPNPNAPTAHFCEEDAYSRMMDMRCLGSSRGRKFLGIREKEERIYVQRGELVDTARKLSLAHPDKLVVVVNPGSATSPGGYVHIGADGVEENLCICSNLYSTLVGENIWKAFYKKNLADEDAEATNACICSNHITIFKKILESVPQFLPESEWGHVHVVTCAPPDMTGGHMSSPAERGLAHKRLDKYDMTDSLVRTTLFSLHFLRGRAICECALNPLWVDEKKSEKILVLPAFGCDYRENPPDIVAEAYAALMKTYAKVFDTVVFAVGEHGDVFREVFQKQGLTLRECADEDAASEESEKLPELNLWAEEEVLNSDPQLRFESHVGYHYEPNDKFNDLSEDIRMTPWNPNTLTEMNVGYTIGNFFDGTSFIAEEIQLSEERGFLMFYMDSIITYENWGQCVHVSDNSPDRFTVERREKVWEEVDSKQDTLSVCLVPSEEVLTARVFAASMKPGEISTDMRKFECYVKYIAGWDILVSSTNRYQGALQYLTDQWGREVVCVMISLKDAYTYMSLKSFQWDTEENDWDARIIDSDAE